MRIWLALALLVAARPALAQDEEGWVRRGSAPTIERLLEPGVVVARSIPADVDGLRGEDALIELTRGARRTLAVARRRGRGWRIDVSLAGEAAWAGVIAAGDLRLLMATRRECGGGQCRSRVHALVAQTYDIVGLGSSAGEPGETLSIDTSASLIASDRGRFRSFGPNAAGTSLWVGPWAPTRELAQASRPFELGTYASSSVVVDGQGYAVFFASSEGISLRSFAPDGAPRDSIDARLAHPGAVLHATRTEAGWAVVVRRDDFRPEDPDDEESPLCGTSVFEIWSLAPPRRATRTDALTIAGRTCEGALVPIEGVDRVAITIDERGIRWVGPGATTFAATAAPAGARLIGVGPESFLVASGDELSEIDASGAVTPGPRIPEVARCFGTERAWSCVLAGERPGARPLEIRPRAGSSVATRAVTTFFSELCPLPGDRVALPALNTYDGDGHVAVFRVVDLASGVVGPPVELGRGFLEDVAADASALYATASGGRVFRIPWSFLEARAPRR